jgi:hypothetical protein
VLPAALCRVLGSSGKDGSVPNFELQFKEPAAPLLGRGE